MVIDVHNNPTDIGISRFLTQGTGFLRKLSSYKISTFGRIIKRKAMPKYYPIVNNARNKYLFFNALRTITNRVLDIVRESTSNYKCNYKQVKVYEYIKINRPCSCRIIKQITMNR